MSLPTAKGTSDLQLPTPETPIHSAALAEGSVTVVSLGTIKK